MEYTKGNWGITKCAVQTYGEPIQHIFITSDSGEFKERTLADIGFWRDFPEKMVTANAHLIAAAPDMYEALEQITDDWSDGEVVREVSITEARNALLRAAGQ